MAGTLASAFLAGAAPRTTTGQMVTRLTPCSCANLDASFSSNTLDTGYAYGIADDHGIPFRHKKIQMGCRTDVLNIPKRETCWP